MYPWNDLLDGGVRKHLAHTQGDREQVRIYRFRHRFSGIHHLGGRTQCQGKRTYQILREGGNPVRTILKFAGIGLLYLAVGWVCAAQTCSNANPCVEVVITNPNPVPALTALWTCVGMTSSNCTSAQLQAAQAGQTATALCPGVVSGNWKCTQFSLTASPQNYNDPHSWGSTINYAAQGVNTAGGVSATSPIITFQVPQAPATPSLDTPKMVTTGNVGLQ
jgi:hypothetical protein